MTNQRVCAHPPVLPRRTTLAALAASPFVAMSQSPLLYGAKTGPSPLERKYIEWLNARAITTQTVDAYLPDCLTKKIEKDVLEPLYQRAEALEDAIVDGPCETASDLAIKLLTVLHIHKETYSVRDMDRLMTVAKRMVNLPDIA